MKYVLNRSSKVNVLHFHLNLLDCIVFRFHFQLKSMLSNSTIHKEKKYKKCILANWPLKVSPFLLSSFFHPLHVDFFLMLFGSFIILTIEKNSLNSAENEAKKQHTHSNILSCKILIIDNIKGKKKKSN